MKHSELRHQPRHVNPRIQDTKNAKKFLEDNPRIRGINGPEFVGLFLKYYKQLDDKYRDMIPLKEVFIPVPKE